MWKVRGSIPDSGGVVFSEEGGRGEREQWKKERSGRKRKEEREKRKGERTVKGKKTFLVIFQSTAGISL